MPQKTIRDHLVNTLEDLNKGELKKFKHKLNEFPIKEGFSNIPRGKLQKADPMDLSDLLLNYYKEEYAVEVVAEVLNAINCKYQAKRFLKATRNRYDPATLEVLSTSQLPGDKPPPIWQSPNVSDYNFHHSHLDNTWLRKADLVDEDLPHTGSALLGTPSPTSTYKCSYPHSIKNPDMIPCSQIAPSMRSFSHIGTQTDPTSINLVCNSLDADGEMTSNTAKEDSVPNSLSDNDSAGPWESSPDDTVGNPRPLSPGEDINSYREQMIRMAENLGLDFVKPNMSSTDNVFGFLEPEASQSLEMPLLDVFTEKLKYLWLNPSNLSSTSERVENLYKIYSPNSEYLFKHPKPNSVIVSSFQEKKHSATHSSPFNDEGRKLDLMGRKGYSSAALTIKVANYQAHMAQYQQFLWGEMKDFINKCSENDKHTAQDLCLEGHRLAKHQMNSALHVMDCAGRSLANSISLRRYAWLRTSVLQDGDRLRVENLAFDCKGLFHNDTNKRLKKMRKK